MGIYYIPCRTCGKTFAWFSGSLDQRCGECAGSPYKDEAVARILQAQASPPEASFTSTDELMEWLHAPDPS